MRRGGRRGSPVWREMAREGGGGWKKSIRCQPLEAEARRAYHEGLGVAKEQRCRSQQHRGGGTRLARRCGGRGIPRAATTSRDASALSPASSACPTAVVKVSPLARSAAAASTAPAGGSGVPLVPLCCSCDCSPPPRLPPAPRLLPPRGRLPALATSLLGSRFGPLLPVGDGALSARGTPAATGPGRLPEARASESALRLWPVGVAPAVAGCGGGIAKWSCATPPPPTRAPQCVPCCKGGEGGGLGWEVKPCPGSRGRAG